MQGLPRGFLSNTNGSVGEIRHVQLVRAPVCSTTYLCDSTDDIISTSTFANEPHSVLRIQTFPDYLLLSVWQDRRSVTVLPQAGEEIVLPISDSNETKSFILLDGYQFIAPSGRWTVEFDYDHSISNSMRPPPRLQADEQIESDTVDPIINSRIRTSENSTDKTKGVLQNGSASKKGIDEPTRLTQPPRFEEPGTASPRVDFSKLDDLVVDSQSSPSRCSSSIEQSTQPLARVENLALLRTNAFRERNNKTCRKKSNQSLASLQEPAKPLTIDPAEATTRQSHTVTGGDVQISSLTRKPVAEIPDKTKASASETESESEALDIDHKNATSGTIQDTIHANQAGGFKPVVQSQKHKDANSSNDESSSRPRKRRRVVPSVAKGLDAADISNTKRLRPTSDDATSSSESAPKQKKVTKQKRTRRNLKTSDDDMTAGTNLEESDMFAAMTDDVSVDTPRRTRSATVDKVRRLPSKPKIVLSSSMSNTGQHEKTIKSLGAVLSDDIAEADVLCAANGEVKKTLKLILAVMYGKFIATEAWLDDCTQKQVFVDPVDYLPDNQNIESTWATNLADALARGRNKIIIRLLKSWTVFISPQLGAELGKSRVRELREIAEAMGATFRDRLPTKKVQSQNCLVLGSVGDLYVNKIDKLGWSLFTREALTMAALRGKLEMDNDFKVQPKIKEEVLD